MTAKIISIIIIRSLAVYTLILSFPYVTNFALLFDSENRYNLAQALLIGAGPFLLHIIASWILFFKANKIGDIIIPSSSEVQQNTIKNSDLEPIALSVIGVVLIASTFSELPRVIGNFFNYAKVTHSNNFVGYIAAYWASLAGVLAQISIGLFLVLRANKLSTILKGLRGQQNA